MSGVMATRGDFPEHVCPQLATEYRRNSEDNPLGLLTLSSVFASQVLPVNTRQASNHESSREVSWDKSLADWGALQRLPLVSRTEVLMSHVCCWAKPFNGPLNLPLRS